MTLSSGGVLLGEETSVGQIQWPRPSSRDMDFITSTDYGSAAAHMFSANWAWGTSAGWPSANRALYFPYYLQAPFLASYAFWLNGSAVSGNIDVGIYNRAGTRLVSTGSTAQSGTTTIQSVDITDTMLSPGVYYIAIAMDNTTGRLWRTNIPDAKDMRPAGCMMQATAFALPSTATFAANTAGIYLPMFGFSTRSTI